LLELAELDGLANIADECREVSGLASGERAIGDRAGDGVRGGPGKAI
jgi:hypothetical protein